MKEKNSQQLLRNPEQEPADALFKHILDASVYGIMKKMGQNFLTAGIDLEWRYYQDGKAWLGKAVYRKKTIVWISIWEDCIKASFYFTEKTRTGVLSLSFNGKIKSTFASTRPTGKLIPLVVDIKDQASLLDFNTLLHYKMNLR